MQREHWLVIIAAIFYGTITVGGKFFADLGLSLYEISLYPMVFMSLFFSIVVLLRRQYLFKKEMLSFFLFYGLIGALAILLQFGAIILGVPVAVVALLLYSQPIWTTVFGKLMLDERVTARKISAVAVAFAGVSLLLRSWNIERVGSPAGIILATLGGIFLSLWIIWGRKSGINNQHYITVTAGWAFSSVLWLLLLWPVIRLFIQDSAIIGLSVGFPLKYWLLLVIFAFIACIIPALFFFKGVQKIDAFIAGIVLLMEPVSATIMASILFAQPIGLNILLGGSLILSSNYLALQKHPR